MNNFQEFANFTQIIDQTTLRHSDIDLHFISTYSATLGQKSKMNPERLLVRYGFLEAIVRCARDKFMKQKTT